MNLHEIKPLSDFDRGRKVELAVNELENLVYRAVIGPLESLESSTRRAIHGHHVAQRLCAEVSKAVVEALIEDAKAKSKALKFSDKGIPILNVNEKCDALAYCAKENAVEDAEGHLWDVLHLVLGSDVPEDWVAKMSKKLGPPTPVKSVAG